MAIQAGTALRALRGLIEVQTRALDEDLPGALQEVVEQLARVLDVRAVAINLHRPAWDDFEIVAIHAPPEIIDALRGGKVPRSTVETLLDPRLFARRDFSTGVLSIALQFFVFFGFIFLVVQYLQLVLGYSPLRAGLAMVPMAMVLGGLSRRVPHLAARVSRRPLAVSGLVLMGVGMLVLAQLDAGSSYWLLLSGLVPVGAGMALATAPATTDIVSALPASKQGVASAVNDAAREVGGTLGIAVLGSLLNQQYRSGVTDAAPADAPPLPAGSWTGCGSGFAAHEAALRRRYEGRLSAIMPGVFPHARDIAGLAAREFEAGRAMSAERALPVYLRDRVALRMDER